MALSMEERSLSLLPWKTIDHAATSHVKAAEQIDMSGIHLPLGFYKASVHLPLSQNIILFFQQYLELRLQKLVEKIWYFAVFPPPNSRKPRKPAASSTGWIFTERDVLLNLNLYRCFQLFWGVSRYVIKKTWAWEWKLCEAVEQQWWAGWGEGRKSGFRVKLS